jgi:hypothetical protein
VFTLVITDYPYRSEGSVREFVAFVFTEVEFYRRVGDHESLQVYHDRYHVVDAGVVVVVQSVRQSTLEQGRHRLGVNFGPDFGGIVITYSDVGAFARGSVINQVGWRDWTYRDSRTNEPFDFDWPFPSLIGPDQRG